MANYSLVVNSKFNPFTYEELAAPLKELAVAHLYIEDLYTDLAVKANIWDNMANKETDPIAYAQYKKYADDLKSWADLLAKEGLNVNSRKALGLMKARYSTEIAPIEVAYNKREALRKEQRDILKADPTRMFERNLDELGEVSSLDRFLENSNYDYGQLYSGNLITLHVVKEADAISKELRSNTLAGNNLRKLLLQILPYQYRILEQTGFNSSDVLAAISLSEEANPILTSMVDRAVQASGILNWKLDEKAKLNLLRLARDYGNLGLWNAVGTTTPRYLTDDYNMRLLLARDAKNQLSLGKRTTGHLLLKPKALRSAAELTAASLNINTFRKFFDKDPVTGEYKMNKAGLEEYYSSDYDTWKSANGAGSYKIKTTSPFRLFMDSLGASKYAGDLAKGTHDSSSKTTPDVKAWLPGNLGNLYSKYIQDNNQDAYDTYHSTEYDRLLTPEYGARVMELVISNIGSEGAEEVDFDGTKGWKGVLKLTETDLKGYHVSNVRYSKYGTTLIILSGDDDKTKHRIKLPIVDKASLDAVQTYIQLSDVIGEILSKGKSPMYKTVNMNGQNILVLDTDKKGNIKYSSLPLSEIDKLKFNQKRREALDNVLFYGAGIVAPSQTSTENITAGTL